MPPTPPSSYIFVLCPPFSGSTILWKLVCTSPQVSAFAAEGQFLPEVREAMRLTPWKAERQMPWEQIKTAWHQHWDASKPFLLEKSPPNLLRAREIREHFQPVHFLIMVRDPYAHSESLMRRSGLSAQAAGAFSTRLLAVQRENALRLEHSLAFTYEELTARPQEISARIQTFLPGLGALDPASGRVAKGGLANSNAAKIASLSAADLAAISAELAKRPDTLRYWGYGLRGASI